MFAAYPSPHINNGKTAHRAGMGIVIERGFPAEIVVSEQARGSVYWMRGKEGGGSRVPNQESKISYDIKLQEKMTPRIGLPTSGAVVRSPTRLGLKKCSDSVRNR